MPRAWLGEPFLLEAEHLRLVNPQAYAREYLGEVTGTGGEVFSNVTLRTISEEEIGRFDHIRRGLDWGYAADPLAYNVCHYDPVRRRLYLFRELHRAGLTNRRTALLHPEDQLRRLRDSLELSQILFHRMWCL